MERHEQRWIGIGGLVFVVLAVALVVIVPTPPAVHASAAKLASHYTKSKQRAYAIGGFVTMAAVIVGAFWFWYFRDLLAAVGRARRLATVGFAGALIFATGGALIAGIDFVLSDASGHASPAALEVLNYMQSEVTLALGAVGVAVFLLATGLVVIRYHALPVWLGWLALVFALATFLVTPVALICIWLWLIPTNIVLIARASSGADPVAVPAAAT